MRKRVKVKVVFASSDIENIGKRKVTNGEDHEENTSVKSSEEF